MQTISKKIIEQEQAGNQDAFSALYKATYGRNYYIALKMVKREAEAEDILQDAYVKIYHKMGQFTYTGENSFASWSAKIVSNTALDFLRRKTPVLFSEMGDEDNDAIYDIEDTSVAARPDLFLDQKETSRIVQELLDVLSDEQRICIIMHYVEQLSISEIAEQCACPEATIKSRLRYARIKLQGQGERLEREGIRLRHVTPMALLLVLLHQETAQAAKKTAPAQKLGGIPAENIAENMSGNLTEAAVSTAAKTVSKKIMALLVAGGVVVGLTGSFAVQNLINGNGQKNDGIAVTPTVLSDVTAMPTGTPEEEGRTAQAETSDEEDRTAQAVTADEENRIAQAETPDEESRTEPEETPEELQAETPGDETVATPTTAPTEKPIPKPTEKARKKPTPKPTEKATKKPTPKPTAEVTKKPKKKATPKPAKKSSDSMEWDDDYVDWDD